MSSPRPEQFDPEDTGTPAARPKFFLAGFIGGLREARIYRAYPDERGISFLWSGPAVAFLDIEMARGGSHDWKTKVADALKTSFVTLGGGLLFALSIGVLVLGRVVVRDVRQGATFNVTDIIGVLLMLVTIFTVVAIVVFTSSVRRIAKRVAELEALSPDQLRALAESGDDRRNFRVTAHNVSEVSIDPHTGTVGGKPTAAAKLTFRHEPTGKWKLNLVSHKDTRAAIRAFRHLIGRDNVDVNVSLKKE